MPATAFTVTTVMEPVNVYQDAGEAPIHAQWDRTLHCHSIQDMQLQTPPRSTRTWTLLLPGQTRDANCLFYPQLCQFYSQLLHHSDLYITLPLCIMVLLSTGLGTLTGFISFLNRAVQSHDGRLQIFISDAILELMKLSKFSKQESGRAHFLSFSWKHKSGPFRMRRVALSMIHTASETPGTEIQPQRVQKRRKKDTVVTKAA